MQILQGEPRQRAGLVRPTRVRRSVVRHDPRERHPHPGRIRAQDPHREQGERAKGVSRLTCSGVYSLFAFDIGRFLNVSVV